MKVNRTISTVIVKPTKSCNADCSYCSAPPTDSNMWDFEKFKVIFDKVEPYLTEEAYLIWHGGEPMQMGVDFYKQCYEYATSKLSGINFSMQTNILLYNSEKWKPVFRDIFKGSLSSSFDPDWKRRSIKGNVEAYKKVFFDKLDKIVSDGFNPMFLGVYDEENIEYADQVYDMSMDFEKKYGFGFDIRFNYCYPAGRSNNKEFKPMRPEVYGQKLVDLYNRWIVDTPTFTITPQFQMFKKIVGLESDRCPWTNNCGGRFLGIEPNGDTYNCADFADVLDVKYRFGNIFRDSMDDILSSNAAKEIRRRRISLPDDCLTCRHFKECQGGCPRDAVIYNRGISGKFFYCESWQMIMDRIKESILSGEADKVLEKLGLNAKTIPPFDTVNKNKIIRINAA